ncbi:heavy-metal-associated domain-containing protein [Lishizhenia sp.]|uniref:heavy-metal-associated domain-containing protein n=1 Tax=Lishizhenia sp. TaxID=2497594 RepID=UPI00299D3B4C|nr:cation transporter [Lishizhenia sp.]MDX1445842.1 cation transporter [Lishizhenia sp.]
MKPFTIIALLGIFSLSACNETSPEAETSVNSEVIEEEKVHDPSLVNANASIDVEVEGMMCVMGCGSEIRKHLYATQAVKSVSFDFLEGRKANTATIQYDDSSISASDLISAIEDIESSDFKAKVKEEEESQTNTSEDFEGEEEESSILKVKTKNISLPNLTEILHHLFF